MPHRIATCTVFVFTAVVCAAQTPSNNLDLISRFGCVNCHTDLEMDSDLNDLLPNLSYAGLRYQSSYLFDFVQNPTRYRKHIGPARMPDFKLSDAEALALALYLEQQNQLPASWPMYPSSILRTTSSDESRSEILEIEDQTCLSCHTRDNRGGAFAVDLTTVGHRLQSDWVRMYLAAPILFDVPPTTMLEVFYSYSSGRFIPLLSSPAKKISQITDRLFAWGNDSLAILSTKLDSVRTRYPDVTSDDGERIFRTLNCVACHNHNTISEPGEALAPILTGELRRVSQSWLDAYIASPYALRPFGFLSHTGTRMPDFQISSQIAWNLAEELVHQTIPSPGMPWIKTAPQKITAFSMDKAQTLLKEKLSCLGCHRIGVEGGRIGPDLSHLNQRLQPLYVINQILEPQQVSGSPVMPKIVLYDKTLRLISNYLYQQDSTAVDSTYLNLLDVTPIVISNPQTAEETYLRFCAMCHGVTGDGDGYNAAYLPKKPTVHSDSTAISIRPDDTLFDGIFAGAYILNKDPYMPPWGFTLTRHQISALVSHIRTLSRSQGPEWSRDDKPVRE